MLKEGIAPMDLVKVGESARKLVAMWSSLVKMFLDVLRGSKMFRRYGALQHYATLSDVVWDEIF